MTTEDNSEFDAGFHALDTSRLGVMSEERLSEAKAQINHTLEEVKRELMERGIPDPPRPKGHPKPLADEDINALTNSEVAGLYAQYVAYASYIGDELAQIEGQEESAKKLLRDTLGQLKSQSFAAGLKGAEATVAAQQNQLYKDLSLEHAKLFFMKAIMQRRYRGYTSQAAALSRIIELRKLDWEQQQRSNNGLGNRQPRPSGFGSRSK